MDFGIRVHRVDNGKDAVDFINENPDVRIIFMDIKMPVMNGFEATEIIRKKDNKILIFAQTAYISNDFKNKAIECGCTGIIEKPINKIEVTKILKNCFEI